MRVLNSSVKPPELDCHHRLIGLGRTGINELLGELIASGHVVTGSVTRSRRYRLE